jgi:autotransporter strand-loop-strand O-heptosyltransferase
MCKPGFELRLEGILDCLRSSANGCSVARWLKNAEFFIGLSSGLSWLAWSMRTPVVMISGVTHPINEFTTPYRVINYHACNSCWNDPLSPFDRSDFLTCPRRTRHGSSVRGSSPRSR